MTGFHFVHTTADRTRQLAVAVTLWLGITAVGILLFAFNPTQVGFFPRCPFRAVTGWQCPGCGSTRALHQLIHLHPIAAFKLNPLMLLTLPFIVYGLLGFTRSVITGQPQRRVFIPPHYLWLWLALLIFFWIFRNTPWYPFVS